jgi:hypothetical protein
MSRTFLRTGGIPTFQQFVDSTFQDEDRGFIVNGDEPATTKGDLRRFYDGMVAEAATPIDGLIVNTVSGRDDNGVEEDRNRIER